MKKEIPINDAKEATKAFVDTFFTNEMQLSAGDLGKIHALLKPFATYVPFPGGRRSPQGEPMDFLAPSFWHACCILIYYWIADRYAATEPSPMINVYRGQTNTWPIKPSLWRYGHNNLGDRSIQTLRSFLMDSRANEPNPTTEFFPEFLTIRGLRAFAQHHEFPTSLIDFSYHPMVALFFASRPSQQLPHTEDIRGMGVIYETSFRNLMVLQNRINVSPELVMLPPSHVFRVYQQRGLFLDCGDIPSSAVTQEIESACTRILFPRMYPEIEGVEDIFSEDRMLSFIPHSNSPFKFSYQFHGEWYAAFDYYVTAMNALKAYCQQTVNFNGAESVIEMKNSTKALHQPASLYNTFGASLSYLDLMLAESISDAAHTIYDIAMFINKRGKILCHPIVELYARANPLFFETLFEISKRVSIYDIEEIAKAFKQVNGLDKIIAGSLSPEQRKRVQNFSEIHYG